MTITRTPRPAPTADELAARYDRQKELLLAEVAELNEVLGLTDAKHKVTFGYIGNGRMTPNGWDLSDCCWSVFLPHPGRVGTDDDCVGFFSTGNLEGITAARRALSAVTQGARLARSL